MYILDVNLLSNIRFANDFFHAVLIVLYYTNIFNFDIVQFIYFYFFCLSLVSYPIHYCQIKSCETFSLCLKIF